MGRSVAEPPQVSRQIIAALVTSQVDRETGKRAPLQTCQGIIIDQGLEMGHKEPQQAEQKHRAVFKRPNTSRTLYECAHG